MEFKNSDRSRPSGTYYDCMASGNLSLWFTQMGDFLDCYQDPQQKTPQNLVYSVLNMCRVYGYLLLHKEIYSKEEIVEVAVDFLPYCNLEVVKKASKIYRGREKLDKFEGRQLIEYSNFLYKKVMELRRI